MLPILKYLGGSVQEDSCDYLYRQQRVLNSLVGFFVAANLFCHHTVMIKDCSRENP